MKRNGLGTLIRTRRNELGLTQADLAGKIGCTPQAIQNWETGYRVPALATFAALAAALDLTAVGLFTTALADALDPTAATEPAGSPGDTSPTTGRAA